MLKICKNKLLFLILPVAIIIAGIAGYFIHGGFKQDVDFAGGSTIQFHMGKNLSDAERKTIETAVKDATGIETAPRVQMTGTGFEDVLIKTSELNDDQTKAAFEAVKAAFPEELKDTTFNDVSNSLQTASYGNEMKRKTLLFSLIAALAMLIYIIIRFDWRSAIMAVVSLAINVIAMLSAYALFAIPLSATFIAAILTIMGYSINDTIVIFDRIRENTKFAKNMTHSEIADKSITESLTRTINTSVTTLITIVILYFMGATTLKEFALPIIIGIVVGSYTSIFVASPWVAAWKDIAREAQKERAAAARASKKSGKSKK